MSRLSILAVGPAQSADLVRDALLLRPHSRLTVAASYWDLCSLSLHQRSHFQVAVLINAGPVHQLRRSAEYIRRRWPNAAILLLGNNPGVLEDALYDQRVPSRIEPDELLAIIDLLDRGKAALEQPETEECVQTGRSRHDL